MQQISQEWIGQVKVIIYTVDCIIITLYMLKAGRNANRGHNATERLIRDEIVKSI